MVHHPEIGRQGRGGEDLDGGSVACLDMGVQCVRGVLADRRKLTVRIHVDEQALKVSQGLFVKGHGDLLATKVTGQADRVRWGLHVDSVRRSYIGISLAAGSRACQGVKRNLKTGSCCSWAVNRCSA